MTIAIMCYAAFMQTVAVGLLVFQSRMMWLTVARASQNATDATDMTDGERELAKGPYNTPTVPELVSSMQSAIPFSQLNHCGSPYL